MNCSKCNQEIPEGSRFCPHCGAEQVQASQPVDIQAEAGAQSVEVQAEAETQKDAYVQPGAPVQNYSSSQQGAPYQNNAYQSPYQQDQGEPVNWVPYLVLSIISTICCCPPFGIVAIIFSAKINSAVNSGNAEEARKSAKTARIWIIVAFAAGIISAILYIALMAFIGVNEYYYYY